MTTPIPPAVQQVLDMYETNLPLVKFGDLEATVLARAAEEGGAHDRGNRI
jgi:hypothetical protein